MLPLFLCSDGGVLRHELLLAGLLSQPAAVCVVEYESEAKAKEAFQTLTLETAFAYDFIPFLEPPSGDDRPTDSAPDAGEDATVLPPEYDARQLARWRIDRGQ